jgi:hypothetical protein
MSTTRREALRQMAAGGAAVVTAPLWVDNLLAIAEQHGAHRAAAPQAAPVAWAPKVLNARQNELVIALAELIIPATDTPGATDARVNQYIDDVLADATPADRNRFLQGLEWVDIRSERRFNRRFVNADPEHQIVLLKDLSTATTPLPDDKVGVEFFRAIKGMTVTGYYTSQVGILQEIGHEDVAFFAAFTGCTHKEHGAG